MVGDVIEQHGTREGFTPGLYVVTEVNPKPYADIDQQTEQINAIERELGNDPAIAERESKAADRERGYLADSVPVDAPAIDVRAATALPPLGRAWC